MTDWSEPFIRAKAAMIVAEKELSMGRLSQAHVALINVVGAIDATADAISEARKVEA